jgi:hypothetical protein
LIAQRYRLDEKVGAGGMGVVWRATDLELGRVVALKRSQSGDGGQIRREARIGAGLQHPNVVTVHDAVIHDEDRWLVMEYLPSRSLSAVIDEDGPLAPEETARIGAQIANALAAMHARGMQHRDIKPGNILVGEDGTAKLTDLGIARWAEETRTDTGLIGTPGYAAPEVADGGASTAAADLFSLGATLFAAVEGGSPWGAGDTPYRQLRRAAAFDLEPVRRAGALTPALDSLLQREPAKRPSAAEVSRSLSEIAGTQPLPQPPKRRRRFRVSRRLLTAGLVVVIAAVVATLLLVPDNEITADTTGDPRTADPCGMYDLNALRKFGVPSFAPTDGLFNHCNVDIRRPDNDPDNLDGLTVRAWIDLPGSEQLVVPEPGRIPFPEETPEEDGECGRVLTLPDGNTFTVRVSHWYGWSAPLCDVANQVIRSALDVLNRGRIPRRPPPAGDSLARLDACSLLSFDEVQAAVYGPSEAEPYFARWSCQWVRGPMLMFISFDRERWPLTPDDEQQAITIDSRQAVQQVGPTERPDACMVEMTHRRFGAEREWVETVEVYVEKEGAAPAMHCARAEAIAGLIGERLPG